jgi:hypothetical protein
VLDYLASRGLEGLAVTVDGVVLQTQGIRALDPAADLGQAGLVPGMGS